MAVESTNTKPEKGKLNKSVTDERFKTALSFFILSLALYLSLAFLSYFFTWKADQSFEWSNVLSNADITVENWAGKSGARIANLFINKWFGVASFSFPFLMIIIGFKLINIKLLPVKRTFRITLIFTILFSVVLGFLFGNLNGFLGSGLGGGHGYVIARWLNAFIGKVGTAFFLTAAVLSFILFSFENAPAQFKRFFGKLIAYYIGKSENNEGITLGDSIETLDLQDNKVNFEKKILHNESFIVEKKHDPEEDDLPEDEIFESENITLTVENKANEDDSISGIHVKSKFLENYDPTLELSSYKLPPVNLLKEHRSEDSNVSNEELISNKNKIVETLANYKIQIDKIKATIGPTVTLYEIVPAPGIRISKIKSLEDDIALSLSALGIRIIAPIPGRGTIGIEVPNLKPEVVSMRSVITSKKFQESNYDLAIGLGKTISNETYVFDLAKMPHLLVAGATGQGKSVGLNAILTSLLYKKHPSQIKFVLVDPKKVELTLYSKIERHFLAKLPETEDAIITDTQKVIHTLNSLTIEMDQRYDLLKMAHVRNFKEYNEKFIKRNLNPQNGHRYLPYIVLVIDEFADLIMTAGREIETPIARLAQLARAIGIHLIIATQRPTTNIITGVIKANFPARIAFRVMSSIDSRTILDSTGANQLIGRGDMLISTGNDLIRVQCAYIDTDELDNITDFIGSQQGYPEAMHLPEYIDENSKDLEEIDLKKRDDLFDEAARLVVAYQQGSTSLIQRKFSIGYNRAGRIIDQLEAAGVVGSFEGSKARQVLFTDENSLEQFLSKLE